MNERDRRRQASGGTCLSDRHAERLLTALDVPCSYAFPDPAAADVLILCTERAGISIGGGRFPARSAELLLRADLVSRDGRGATRISETGRAHLRRGQADTAEGPFRGQHLRVVPDTLPDERGAPVPVRRDAAESPLEWMRRRRDRNGVPLLDAASYEAGERLRRDLTFAALLPRTTASWSAVGAAGKGGAPRDPAAASDAVVAARQRVNTAMEAVGNDLAGLLVDLCGFLKGLELIERERDWPPRSGKVVVRLALGRLAEHYGLARQAEGPARALSIRAWREGVPI